MLAQQATTLDGLQLTPPSRAALLRRLAPGVVLLAAAVLVAVLAPGVARVFTDALQRALDADPSWVVVAIGFEMLSVAGYIVLFWHVASRANSRVGLRASAEVSLAGAAATRLLPTAGAGGAALTWWSLRRAGQPSREATRTLLTFLVLLYSVFLGALLAAAIVLVTSRDVPLALSLPTAAGATTAIVLAWRLGFRHRRGASHAFGAAVAEAFQVVGRPNVRLLGAFAWWACDMLVLWALFNAFGTPPAPAVLVLGYFLGQVANTIP